MISDIFKMLFLLFYSFLFAISSVYGSEIVEFNRGVSPAKTQDAITLNETKGNPITVICDLKSNATTDIIWKKNGTQLISNSHYNISQSLPEYQNNSIISRKSTLKISSLISNDTGTYNCELNATSNDFKTFQLTVIDLSNSRDLWLSYLFILTVICICILGVYVLKYTCKLY